MGRLKIGDIVARKSYGGDIFFKVADIINNGKENIVILKGISYRIQADAPESDLMLLNDTNLKEHDMKMRGVIEKKCRDITSTGQRGNSKKAFFRDTPKEEARSFAKSGKVLHLDGDNDYLDTCIKHYERFGMEVTGRYVPEKDQASVIYKLLEEQRPDILVLTGHDGMLKGNKDHMNLKNYRNSRYFRDAVYEARRYQHDLDSLVIFAGACQSMYSEIIDAGANFASSPFRVLIHALDPVFVCQKVAFANTDRVLEPEEVICNTITGKEGIGGIQTRGKYRDGFPAEPYK